MLSHNLRFDACGGWPPYPSPPWAAASMGIIFCLFLLSLSQYPWQVVMGRGADSNLLRFLCCAFSSQLTLDEHVVLPPFRIDLRSLRDRRKGSVGLYTRILSGYGDVELLRWASFHFVVNWIIDDNLWALAQFNCRIHCRYFSGVHIYIYLYTYLYIWSPPPKTYLRQERFGIEIDIHSEANQSSNASGATGPLLYQIPYKFICKSVQQWLWSSRTISVLKSIQIHKQISPEMAVELQVHYVFRST